MRDLKKALAEGKKVVGTFIWDFNVPFLPKFFANAGYDYVIIDNEHGCFSYTDLQIMVQIARGADIAALVRVPKIDRECIQRYWDLGVDGVVVPMVNTAAEAKEVVRLSKYAPEGEKGIAFYKGSMDFRMDLDINEFFKESNEKGLILVQAESRKSVSNIRDILAVEGVDGVFVGPFDLSADYGKAGDLNNPAFLEGVEQVFAATTKAGKISACFSGNQAFLEKVLAMGVNFITWSTESILFHQGISAALETVKKTKGFEEK